MNNLKILFFLLILTFPTQSEELNFRGSSAQIINKDEIKIRISDEMLKLDSFKGISKKYKGIKSYAGLIDKKVQKRKKESSEVVGIFIQILVILWFI